MANNMKLTDITPHLQGRRIRIRCSKGFVSVSHDEPYAPVYIRDVKPGEWETFTVWVAPDNWCGLRAANDKFLTVRADLSKLRPDMAVYMQLLSDNPIKRQPDANGVPLIYASADIPEAWEMFKFYTIGSRIAICAQYNQLFVGSWNNSELAPLLCQEDIANFEQYELLELR